MCFSATASFTAGAVLIGAGVVTRKKARNTRFSHFAAIPMLFGIQQTFEGALWLGLENEALAPLIGIGKYAFLLFAWVVWPIYVPFSVRKIETNVIRRKLLQFTQMVGVAAAAILAYILFFHEVIPMIKGQSIFYEVRFETNYNAVMTVLYLICTVAPPLLSATRKVWMLGLVTGVLYMVTLLFYTQHLLSVWCFFSAIGSIFILWIIQSGTHRQAPLYQN